MRAIKTPELAELCKAAKQYSDEYIEYVVLKQDIEKLEVDIQRIQEKLQEKRDRFMKLQYPQKAFERLREAALKYGEERNNDED